MSRHSRHILIAGIALLPALWLPAGREACAQQINLVSTRGLDFGRFVAGSGGTVTIGANGQRTRTGGVILLNSPSTSQATFTVSRGSNGGSNKAAIISLPANGSVRLTSGGNSMTLGSFANTPVSLLSVPAAGVSLALGATLTVGANQPPGNYSGSIPVTVNFQ